MFFEKIFLSDPPPPMALGLHCFRFSLYDVIVGCVTPLRSKDLEIKDQFSKSFRVIYNMTHFEGFLILAIFGMKKPRFGGFLMGVRQGIFFGNSGRGIENFCKVSALHFLLPTKRAPTT